MMDQIKKKSNNDISPISLFMKFPSSHFSWKLYVTKAVPQISYMNEQDFSHIYVETSNGGKFCAIKLIFT